MFTFATNKNRHIRANHKKLIRKFECNECGLQCGTKHSHLIHSQRRHGGTAGYTIIWDQMEPKHGVQRQPEHEVRRQPKHEVQRQPKHEENQRQSKHEIERIEDIALIEVCYE